MLDNANNKKNQEILAAEEKGKKKNQISTKQLAIIFVGVVVALIALLFFAIGSEEKITTLNINTSTDDNKPYLKPPSIIDQNSFDEEAIKSIKHSVENNSNTTTKIDNSPYLRPPIIVEEVEQIPEQYHTIIQEQPLTKIQSTTKKVVSSNNNLEEEIYNNMKNYMQSIKNDITIGSDFFIFKNKKYYENDLINGYKILEIGDYFIRVYEENWTYKLRILGDK